MEITYDYIRKIYRLEKETSKLTHIEPDFYDLLSEYVAKEKEKLREAVEKLDIEAMKRFLNLKKLVTELVLLRMKKVIRYTLLSITEGGEEPENIVGWERELYEQMREILSGYRERITNLFEERVERKEEKPLNVVRVRILADIPTFLGADFKEYGPFRAGEEVPLPRDVAEILIRRGVAEVIG